MDYFDFDLIMSIIDKAAMPVVVVIIIGIVVNYVLPRLLKLSIASKENKIRKELLAKQRALRQEREAAAQAKIEADKAAHAALAEEAKNQGSHGPNP